MLVHDFWRKTVLDPAIFWSMVTAIGTLLLVYIAWIQLKDIAKTRKHEFIDKIKSVFFTVEARRLLFLIEYDFLRFHAAAIPYFEVVKTQVGNNEKRYTELGITWETLSTYTVDDVLLGPLEDVGILEASRVIDVKQAYLTFSYYVIACWENKQIQNYVEWARKDRETPDIYSQFENLYKKMKKYEETANR